MGILVFDRRRGSGLCYHQIREANQVGIRKGLFPVSVDQQKALCWSVLDETGEVGQDGHEGY
jgi:hypothetical protein